MAKQQTAEQIRARIEQALPVGSVLSAHTDKAHFYNVPEIVKILPSVTAKLQILKEPGLLNWKKNQALNYIFTHYKEFNEGNIMKHIELADKADSDIFTSAGDIGREVHDARERYFNAWIKAGKRPMSGESFIKEDMGIKDSRAMSAIGALEKFVNDYNYVPVWTELMLWSEKLGVGGTLDDLGFLQSVVREGDPGCDHDVIGNGCVRCDYKIKQELVLMDIKTSNQIKDSYLLQLAFYAQMLYERTGIKPKRYMIVQLSKENRTYKVEEISSKDMTWLRQSVKRLVKLNEDLDRIKVIRKRETFKI